MEACGGLGNGQAQVVEIILDQQTRVRRVLHRHRVFPTAEV
jgi:hypothetical protein